MSKRKRESRKELEIKLGLYKQLISALVAKLGGHVAMSAEEINHGAGDRCEMMLGREGCVLHIERKIRLVSTLTDVN